MTLSLSISARSFVSFWGRAFDRICVPVAGQGDNVVVVFADIDADEYVDISVIGDHVTHLLRLM